MAAALHMVDEFAIELVELVPAADIPLHPLGRARHPQIGLGQRLLEFSRKADRLIDILVGTIPMALPALTDPFQPLGCAYGLGRHRMNKLSDDVAIDFLEMVDRH